MPKAKHAKTATEYLALFIGVIWGSMGLYRNIGIMEKKMEITIMGYMGRRVGLPRKPE